MDLRTLLSRMTAMFRTRRLDNSLDEELHAHLDLAIEDYVRRGVPMAEARRRAMREFGGMTQVRESYRVRRGLPFLEQVRRDIHFGVFQLYKSPGFTLTAILTLALGVGANTTVFSMINGLLLRPLPVPHSSRLALLKMELGGPQPRYSFPDPLFRGLETQHGAFSGIFAFDHEPFQLKSGASTEIVLGQYVSGSFFTTLEVPPLMGRTLTPQDDRKGGDPSGFSVVISESLWEDHLQRNPGVIGTRLVIDNVAFTIVGVMPRSFFGADPLQRPHLFVPLADEEVLNGERSMIKAGHHGWWLSVMGRLAPGTTLEQANSQLAAATNGVLHTIPDAAWVARYQAQHFRFAAESGATGFTYMRLFFSKPLVAVFIMCGGVLLLACLNLAGLLLARGTARQRELATRMSLGASRFRLIQQLLIEGLMLGFIGTAAGLMLAPAVSRLLVAVLLGGESDAHLDTSLDLRVFGFAAVVAMLATMLFALAPALRATRRSSLMDRMKDGQHSTLTQERRAILPRMLLGAEVGLAFILVVAAGLVATSLVRLYSSGEGFDPRGVENIKFSMDKAGLKGDAVMEFYREMGQRLSHLPGVTSVSFARIVPLSHLEWDEDFNDAQGASHDIYMNSVAPAYFATMRIPLLAGREFAWTDTPTSGLKIILNQTAARLLFPGGNALGQRLRQKDGDKFEVFDVVGIVGDAKYSDMRTASQPTAYPAMSQENGEHSPSFTGVIRTSMSTGAIVNGARAVTAEMAPSVPAPKVTSMISIVDSSLSSERMMTLLAVFFAVCALVVTAVGLYGTLSYATARRTVEIGIRMALGAQRGQVAAMVFGQNLWVVMGGTVLGLAAALLATRALASFLFLTSAHDPWIIALSIFALALTACAASLLPALRAARIEPMSAIRCE